MSDDDLKRRMEAEQAEDDAKKEMGRWAHEEGRQAARQHQESLGRAEGLASRFCGKFIERHFNEIKAKYFFRSGGGNLVSCHRTGASPYCFGKYMEFADDRLELVAFYDESDLHLFVKAESGEPRQIVYQADKKFPISGCDETESGPAAVWFRTYANNAAVQLRRATKHSDRYKSDVSGGYG